MVLRQGIERFAPRSLQHRAQRTDEIAVALTAFAFLYGALVGRVTGLSARLDVSPHMHGTAVEAVSLLLRNGVVCVIMIGFAHARRVPRWVASIEQMLAGAVPLGTALLGGVIAGDHGGLRYLPHAPLELLAAAMAGAWPLRALSVAPTRTSTTRRAAIVLALLIVAALLETFATPRVGGTR